MDKRAEISGTTGEIENTTTNGILQYFLNRLRESTTWIGILLSTLEIPKRIEDPVTQIILAVLSIAMICVKEGQTQDSPESKGRTQ